MSIELDAIIDKVRRELNPDGAGYHTDEAVNLIYYYATQGCGLITKEFENLAR